LHRFDFKSGTDVGEAGRTKREGFRVVLLPMLVLGAQVKGSRVLEIWWEHNGLVTSLARQLHPKIPCIEGHKGELHVVRQVLLDELIETRDGIPE
jgi:hypothetical protein